MIDVIDRVPGLAERESALRQEMLDTRVRARQYTREHGQDLPEVRQWVVPDGDNTQRADTPDPTPAGTTSKGPPGPGPPPLGDHSVRGRWSWCCRCDR